MSITLYFSKVNINSHIFDVYEDKDRLKEILKKLYLNIEEDVSYIKQNLNYVEHGNTYTYDAEYKFNLIDKLNDNTIAGTVMKTSTLFVNQVNKETGDRKKIPVENSEVIEFYFDVYKEIVTFYKTNRFGHVEFTEAFQELVNKCMSKESEQYHFEVALLREGLNVEDIQTQLKAIGKLETLKIEIIPPNPDDDLLDEIQENGEEYITDIKEGNVTHTSTIFTSKETKGLNIDAKIIQDEFKKVSKIHSKLTDEEATMKGYVTVEATNKSGRRYSTNNNKAITDKIEEKPENFMKFATICKRKIASVVNSLK
ncbi:hypothetical protein DT250_04390 [Bacillus sp. AR2-1]|uniref:hypothetical protein n=1 Tax=Bacillus sp. AR2-1 TaxID=2217816 RepID=UPI0011EF4356|nr:hypothetical protein [Bacillus sp. AR2-1]KAA0776212.1 hypothetical protein DT250_04390 [Bacillus sp. AR2-1]